MNQDEINRARVVFYGLFASLFTFFETDENFEKLKNSIEVLSKTPLDLHTKEAFLNMKNFLDEKGFDGLKEEANEVLYSPSTSFIPMSASYYVEARDDGKKRQEMIELVNLSNFRRDDDKYKDNEDNIAFMFNFLHHLIQNTLDGDENAEKITRGVFERVLNEVVDEFINNVYKHESSDFYKNLAVVLKVFIEYERHLYGITATSKKQEIKEADKSLGSKQKVASEKKAKRNHDEFETL